MTMIEQLPIKTQLLPSPERPPLIGCWASCFLHNLWGQLCSIKALQGSDGRRESLLNLAISCWNSWEVALHWQLRAGGDQETGSLWVLAGLWPFINVLPSESSCVRRACCWADTDSSAWEAKGGVSINTRQRLGYGLWWPGCMNNCSSGGSYLEWCDPVLTLV